MSGEDVESTDERAERRERRQQSARDAIRKHGAKLGEIYRAAVLKRARRAAQKQKPKASR
jgi:hypothetical protein